MALGAQSWDTVGMLYALLPLVIIVMMVKMIGGVVEKVTEPEYVKEVAPVVVEAVSRKLLPKGRG